MICNRLYGRSCRDCECRIPDDGGWKACPPHARGMIPRKPTGDVCIDCGSSSVTRAGVCLLCLDCGSTSGGCS